MTPHADCEDCPWSYEGEDLIEVSDEAERHQRKELHDVDVHRGVATDGSGQPWVADCQQCGFRAVVKEGSITRTIAERAKMAAGGHKSTYPDHEVDCGPVDDSGATVHKCDICSTRFPSVVDLVNHDCDDYIDENTSGIAMDGGRIRYQEAESAQSLAGVGDQDQTCKHGTVGCPGPEGHWTDTCLDCFAEGGANDE